MRGPLRIASMTALAVRGLAAAMVGQASAAEIKDETADMVAAGFRATPRPLVEWSSVPCLSRSTK